MVEGSCDGGVMEILCQTFNPYLINQQRTTQDTKSIRIQGDLADKRDHFSITVCFSSGVHDPQS